MQNNFKLEVQRAGRPRPQTFLFVDRLGMEKAIREYVKQSFVGHMEPYRRLENGQWELDQLALKMLTPDPLPEQQMLLSQMAELFAQLAKEKTMLNDEQKLECQNIVAQLFQLEGIEEEEVSEWEMEMSGEDVEKLMGLNHLQPIPVPSENPTGWDDREMKYISDVTNSKRLDALTD
jgi:hypothetical protein